MRKLARFSAVNEHNGTLQLIRGGHRRAGPGSGPTIMQHFLENTRDGANSHSMVDANGSANVDTGHPDSWYVYAKDDDLPTGEYVTADMQLGTCEDRLLYFEPFYSYCELHNN